METEQDKQDRADLARPCVLTSLKTGAKHEVSSVRLAALNLGVSLRQALRAIRKQRPSLGGFVWDSA